MIFSHISIGLGGSGWIGRLGHLGSLGVHIFFVLSGYLITTLLVREFDRDGTVSVRAFVWRRITRIVPAYLAFLFVLWLTVPKPENARWWPALTYTTNLFGTNWWYTGHTWSLSVEEQFYITWPILLGVFGPGRARWIALTVFLSAPFCGAAVYLLTHSGGAALSFDHAFIAAGAFLALVRPNGFSFRQFWIAPVAAFALTVLFADAMRWMFVAKLFLGVPLEALAITAMLAWCLAEPRSRIGRVLDWRPFRALGLISYSLYLWQQPFLGSGMKISPWLGVSAALVVATASYWLVERPGLALRKKLPHWLRALRPTAVQVPAPE